MPKKVLFTVTLIVIAATAYLTYAVNSRLATVSKNDIETAVNQAKHLYNLKKERGESFEEGLCLSDALLPNWVVDIVHHPRQPRDDKPENQCPALLEGRAKHFVELDTEGRLIRAQ